MTRPIKTRTNGNGATSDGKLAPKIANTADAASSDRAIAQAAAFSSLAVVSGLISQTMLEISQEGLRVQQELKERSDAFLKAAVDSGTDPERILKTVLREIESETATLEQMCCKQLAFWSEISQRMAGINALRKMNPASYPKRPNDSYHDTRKALTEMTKSREERK